MSGPFAIAAVTAVLQRLLTNGLGNVDLSIFGGNATVITAHAPDLITVGTNEPAQLNLFLYRVTPNAALRNDGLASRGPNGERLTNPPLALDLHYLLTAYGAQEFYPEALLGYGMQVLHEVPFLSRDLIRGTWSGPINDPVEQALADSGLVDQIEYIKLTPQNLSTEELSKLWTAFQAKYRMGAGYVATVLLIQAAAAARAALPVLKQGPNDGGPRALGTPIPPFPTIDSLTLPKNQPAALLGNVVQINGHDFAGDTGNKNAVSVTVRLSNSRYQIQRDIAVPAANRNGTTISFTVPTEPANLPAGVYTIQVIVTPLSTPTAVRTTNQVPLLIAPSLVGMPLTLNTGIITVGVSPDVRPGQQVSLIMDGQELPSESIQAQSGNISFDASPVPAGAYLAQLRVDGVDSLLVDRSDPRNPKFDQNQTITLH